MYAMKEAIRGMRRTASMTVVSIVTIAVTLSVLAVFGAATVTVHGFMQRVRGSEEINIYLEDSLSDTDLLALDRAISDMPEVGATRIITKESAAEEFEEMFGDGLLDALDENPLPRTIVVSMDEGFLTAEAMGVVAQRLEGATGVESIQYGRDWMSWLDILFMAFIAIEIIFIVLASGACLLVVANTITLTVIARRDTIEIMQLVGATDSFIRRPFHFEGMLQGLAAGCLSFGVIYIAYRWLLYAFPGVDVYLFAVSMPYRIDMFREWIGVLIMPVGALVGYIGSWFAMRRVI